MTKKEFILILGFILGFLLLFDSSANITGAVVGFSNFASVSLGLILVFVSVILLTSGLEKITLTSAVKKQPSILRLTKEAVQDQYVENDINHLIKELVKGNSRPGIGRPGHIDGTDVFYLRGRNGGRLYYHRVGQNSYEIVGKSAKGRNEDQVINKLREIYEH